MSELKVEKSRKRHRFSGLFSRKWSHSRTPSGSFVPPNDASSDVQPPGAQSPLDQSPGAHSTPAAVHSPGPSISQKPMDTTIRGDQSPAPGADLTDTPKADPISLWDQAYDALKKDNPSLVNDYEDLMSRALQQNDPNSQAPTREFDEKRTSNVISNDVAKRRDQLKQITRLGSERMESKKISTTILGHEISLGAVVSGAGKVLDWASGYINDVLADVPYGPAVAAGVSLILPLLNNPTVAEEANKEGLVYVTSQMNFYNMLEDFLPDVKPEMKEDFTQRVKDLYKLVIEFQLGSVIRFYRSRTRNYFYAVSKYDGWEAKRAQIESDERALQKKLQTGFAVKGTQHLEELSKRAADAEKVRGEMLNTLDGILGVMQRMARQISTAEDQKCLNALHPIDPKDDKDRLLDEKGGLIWEEPSFKWINENPEFHQWRDNAEEKLLWVKGDPGKGKTMLLCGVIEELINSVGSAGNVAFFFFQERHDQYNKVASLLRSLIYMLVKQQTALFPILRDSFNDLGNSRFEGKNAHVALKRIFEDIIQSPLLQTTYLVVDGLDECVEGLDQLLTLIKTSLSSNAKVKWVVSSRNLRKIETELREATSKRQLSLELNEKTVAEAVRNFVKIKVDQLSEKHNYDAETKKVISERLIKNSGDTFLWVALVFQQLKDAPCSQARALSAMFPKGLDPLYELMTNKVVRSNFPEICFQVLSAVALAHQPLTIPELSTILDLPDFHDEDQRQGALRDIIGDCGSLLTWGKEGEVLFVHHTAKEHLKSKRFKDLFPSGEAPAHRSIFVQSMQAMCELLDCDICRLNDPGFPIEDLASSGCEILHPVRYSCLYWVDHLVAAGFDDSDLEYSDLDDFFQVHYLHWLEALSLLKGIPTGASSMLRIDEFFTTHHATGRLVSLVRDASRFLQHHQRTIEQNPLQAYTSALIFSPAGSATRCQYTENEPDWMITKPMMDDDWTACISTLNGHMGSVQCLALSRYGKLASASYDGMVRIWNLSTGTCLMSFEADKTPISSVKWLRTETVATVSTDGIVRLWDTSSDQGKVIGKPQNILEVEERKMTPNGRTTPPSKNNIGGFKPMIESFISVAWSQTLGKLALATEDGTVYTWTHTGNKAPTRLGEHGSPITSLAWTGDDRLATAGENGNITIWYTGMRKRWVFTAHTEPIISVAWSKDSSRLASVSTSSTISIWNPKNGKNLGSFDGKSAQIHSLAWSKDGRLAGVDENKIKIWHPHSGQLLSELEGHTHRIWSFVWLADGNRIASASRDRSIKVWDVSRRESSSTLPSHRETVNAVVWSPERDKLASASVDGTIKIWDASNGELQKDLNGHGDSVLALAWSNDGSKLASGSKDSTLMIWDTATGDLISTHKEHSGSVTSVAWSNDDSKLASASDDHLIKIWNAAETVSPLMTLEGHADSVSSVAWSSDGAQLTSVSQDQTMMIWDANEGSSVLNMPSESYFNRPVAWSQDSQIIVTASGMGRKLQIWDFGQSPDSPVSSTIDLNQDITWLQFDESEPHHLHTNFGTFDLDPQAVIEASQMDPGSINPLGYGIDGNTNWVTWQGEKKLKLPEEVAIGCSAIFPEHIAIGCNSGKVFTFRVEEDGPVQMLDFD